jgi:Golgi phosphoprotein 3
MASTGGLTRRRGGGGGGGGGGGAATLSDEGERSSSPAASRPRDSLGGGETAYTTENGHKIGTLLAFPFPSCLSPFHHVRLGEGEDEMLIGTTAYDPRDISENQERNKLPKLTLMEEILLLGLKDKQVTPPSSSSFTIGRNR